MKKLSSINCIEFRFDYILIDEIVLNLDDDIVEWIERRCNFKYTVENYTEKFSQNKKIQFNGINGITIFTIGSKIKQFSIYLNLPNDSRNKFEGDIIVFGKTLSKPFLSDDIEIYFPSIKLEKPPKGYWERFNAWEFVDYPFNEYFKIEISMNRDPKYIGTLSLRRI